MHTISLVDNCLFAVSAAQDGVICRHICMCFSSITSAIKPDVLFACYALGPDVLFKHIIKY